MQDDVPVVSLHLSTVRPSIRRNTTIRFLLPIDHGETALVTAVDTTEDQIVSYE